MSGNVKFDKCWNEKIWKVDEMKDHYDICLLMIKPFLKDVRVLDIGCGNGLFTNVVRENGSDVMISGIDVSEVAINEARKNYPGMSFFNIDLLDLISRNRYDIIICLDVLYYIDNIGYALTILCSLLEDGGLILCSLVIDKNHRFNEVMKAIIKKFNFVEIECNYKYNKLIMLLGEKK